MTATVDVSFGTTTASDAHLRGSREDSGGWIPCPAFFSDLHTSLPWPERRGLPFIGISSGSFHPQDSVPFVRAVPPAVTVDAHFAGNVNSGTFPTPVRLPKDG